MERRTYIPTSDEIRESVFAASEEAEQEVSFPSEEAKEEFVEDLVDCIMEKYHDFKYFDPNYYTQVLDLAKVYGYLI